MNHNEVIENLVKWLQEQVEKTHSNGLLVGVSGGIDSAVVANLIKKACPQNSLGVVLPIHSSTSSVKDAKLLIEQCKLDTVIIDLSDEHEMILKKSMDSIKDIGIFKEEYLRMTDANLRARLRMSTLYSIANNLGYMVVGTDNADETYTGYFTKYGDGGVDILPLKKIYKKDVYEIGRLLGVHENIMKKAPSADLWENQTDEQEMGVTYAAIEKYMSGEKVSDEEEKIIKSLHEKSEHKRTIPPHFEV